MVILALYLGREYVVMSFAIMRQQLTRSDAGFPNHTTGKVPLPGQQCNRHPIGLFIIQWSQAIIHLCFKQESCSFTSGILIFCKMLAMQGSKNCDGRNMFSVIFSCGLDLSNFSPWISYTYRTPFLNCELLLLRSMQSACDPLFHILWFIIDLPHWSEAICLPVREGKNTLGFSKIS